MIPSQQRTVDWKRARTSVQIEQRINSILSACEKLLSKTLPQDLKMREIAEECGLAVGAIYRYFRSKEVLIMAVYLNKMRELLDELADFSHQENSAHNLSEHMTTVFVKHKFFWFLSTYSGTILETSLTDEEIREHKSTSMEMTTKCIEKLVQHVPGMNSTEIFDLFMDSFFYTCGLYSFAFPTETIKKILEEPALNNFKPDWDSSIRRMFDSFLSR